MIESRAYLAPPVLRLGAETKPDVAPGDVVYRAGVVQIADCFLDAARRWLLPPEHRVAAIRGFDWAGEEWLVEGPTLPPVPASGVPELVEISCRVAKDPNTGAISLCARWQHAADKPWTMGSWPNLDAYLREFNS